MLASVGVTCGRRFSSNPPLSANFANKSPHEGPSANLQDLLGADLQQMVSSRARSARSGADRADGAMVVGLVEHAPGNRHGIGTLLTWSPGDEVRRGGRGKIATACEEGLGLAVDPASDVAVLWVHHNREVLGVLWEVSARREDAGIGQNPQNSDQLKKSNFCAINRFEQRFFGGFSCISTLG